MDSINKIKKLEEGLSGPMSVRGWLRGEGGGGGNCLKEVEGLGSLHLGAELTTQLVVHEILKKNRKNQIFKGYQ